MNKIYAIIIMTFFCVTALFAQDNNNSTLSIETNRTSLFNQDKNISFDCVLNTGTGNYEDIMENAGQMKQFIDFRCEKTRKKSTYNCTISFKKNFNDNKGMFQKFIINSGIKNLNYNNQIISPKDIYSKIN